MCGRFVITSPPAAIRQVFGYAEQPNFPPRFNVAPTQPVPVVILERGARHFRLMRWGLVPSWVKDPRKFSLLINARRETVQEKPAFKNAVRRRRCLIPADGYYEWHVADGRRRPYFIYRRDRAPFGFAALAETWIGPNGEETRRLGCDRHSAGKPRPCELASPRAGDADGKGFCALARLLLRQRRQRDGADGGAGRR